MVVTGYAPHDGTIFCRAPEMLLGTQTYAYEARKGMAAYGFSGPWAVEGNHRKRCGKSHRIFHI